MVGQTLGHYRILELLGKGGMGEVYRAEDSILDRQVALKVLPSELADDSGRLARFRREAKTLAALDHPNIVTIHSVEEEEGITFLTMQLVDGTPLSRQIPRRGMSLDSFFEIAIPLAETLAFAHEKGIIHRDLKPGNVMVTREGRVKVLDFGLAKLFLESTSPLQTDLSTQSLTEDGRIVGTVPYMSPEQLEGRSLDARSDIFSLGVILYEMATGQRPFRGESSISIISAIVKDSPEEIDQLRDDLPHHLGRIVRHCLGKDPENRYQTAKDVRNELEDLSHEVSSTQTQTQQIAPPRRSQRRWGRGLRLATALAAIALVALLVLYFAQTRRFNAAPSYAPITAIAVLPLQNLSGDPEQEYFADGMTEALITDLAKIGALKVISRTSVMQYKGVARPLGEIASELGVDALVEGSVLHADNRIRINAQLIHAATDQHLWAESYDRDLHDVLALQSEVARAIAGEIEVAITPEEQQRLKSAQSIDPSAYQAYLKGRYHWSKRTAESLTTARDYFLQTLEHEPNWAPAFAGLSDTYSLLGSYGYLSPDAAYPRAKAAAVRAIEADETFPEAHSSLGWVHFLFDWDWQAAERELERALELNPGHATARHWHALFLSAMGRQGEAVAEIRRAQELDPLSLIVATNHGWIEYFGRSWDAAATRYLDVLDLEPHFSSALWKLAEVYGEMGRYDEALAVNQTGMEEFGWDACQKGQLLARSGRDDEARTLIDELMQIARSDYISAFEIAAIFAALGDADNAMSWLERAYEGRDGGLAFLKVEPRFDALRTDARFQELLQRMNLAD